VILVLDSFNIFFSILGNYWWAYLPVFSFFLLWMVFKLFMRMRFLAKLKWTVLEIKIPKALDKSPKSAEQVFAGLHGTHIPLNRKERFLGNVHAWFSLETVGKEGEIHYYIRTPEKFKNLVESQIYAQYADAEIEEVPDYTNGMPMALPSEKYDLFGSELILSKPDVYPIRTYEEFEDTTAGRDEVKRVDPMASLSEVLSTLHRDEHIWIQIVIRPTGNDWAKRAQGEIDKILKKPSKAPDSLLANLFFAIDKNLPGGSETGATEKKENIGLSVRDLTPGQRAQLEAIEKSTLKLGYETAIRFVYIAPKDSFHRAHISGVVGAYKQFSSTALNGFRPVKKTMPVAKGLFKNNRNLFRKRMLMSKMRSRFMFDKSYVLNTEELATIYHFPDVSVRTPSLPRVESKKGRPPTGLPVM
jgi:hypothetical protein